MFVSVCVFLCKWNDRSLAIVRRSDMMDRIHIMYNNNNNKNTRTTYWWHYSNESGRTFDRSVPSQHEHDYRQSADHISSCCWLVSQPLDGTLCSSRACTSREGTARSGAAGDTTKATIPTPSKPVSVQTAGEWRRCCGFEKGSNSLWSTYAEIPFRASLAMV